VTAVKGPMRGMTLVELMIVVAIIGILAAITYPSYREFTARATRNEAKAALLKAATNQERFYLQNNQFSGDLNQLGFSASPYTTDTGSYVISVSAPNPAANFTVTATYQHSDAESGKCEVFTIDGRGMKESSPATDCWARTR
jgi:type IV pilus assembly protein PilE